MRRLTNIAWALAAVAAFLILQGLLDRQERVWAERMTYREWARRACMPTTEHQRAVARIEDGKLACTIYDNAGYGRIPVVAAAAYMEIPQ